jgi:hypothetical protein
MVPWNKRQRTISDFNRPIDFDDGAARQVQYSHDASGRPRIVKEFKHRIASRISPKKPNSPPAVTQTNETHLMDHLAHANELDLEMEVEVDDAPISPDDFPTMIVNRKDPNVRISLFIITLASD